MGCCAQVLNGADNVETAAVTLQYAGVSSWFCSPRPMQQNSTMRHDSCVTGALQMVTEPDTGVDVEVDQFILMEDEASTSTSTSGSDSSSSDYEGSDDDDGRADGERRSEPLRADIAADETAFADSSVAFKPAKPTVRRSL